MLRRLTGGASGTVRGQAFGICWISWVYERVNLHGANAQQVLSIGCDPERRPGGLLSGSRSAAVPLMQASEGS